MSTEAIAGFTAAGVAFFGVIATAFLWLLWLIKSENRDLRAEIKSEINDARAEARENNARLRQEMREDNARLRQEMREDNARLREELLTEIREGNQRILEALYYHRHDPDGAAAFYPPQAAD